MRWRPRTICAAIVSLHAPGLTAELFAQGALIAGGRGVITGTVTDSALRPLGGVDVTVVGTSSRLATDSEGRFQLLQVAPGDFLVWVRRLGYQPASVVVNIGAADTLRLAFVLEPAVTALGSVVITETARSPKMREFDDRRKAGIGEFLDQAQIEKLNFLGVDDVLRTFKSVRVGLGGVTSSRNPIGVPPCPMQIFLDGLPKGAGIFDLPSPKEVAGIEVYAGPATTPVWVPKLDRYGGKPSCGVVLIWLRDGS